MGADGDDELRQRVKAFIDANTQKAFLAATDGIDRKTLKSFLDGEHDTRPTKVAAIAAAMDELDARAARLSAPTCYGLSRRFMGEVAMPLFGILMIVVLVGHAKHAAIGLTIFKAGIYVGRCRVGCTCALPTPE